MELLGDCDTFWIHFFISFNTIIKKWALSGFWKVWKIITLIQEDYGAQLLGLGQGAVFTPFFQLGALSWAR